jgi:hypothetical protein
MSESTSLTVVKAEIKIIEPKNYSLINIEEVTYIPEEFPEDFIKFCKKHDLKPPGIHTWNGKALSVMLTFPYKYWNREACEEFIKKFKIKSKDSIQLFNKHSQWGIRTNSGIEKGRQYIIYPYCLSNKHKMRKDFKFDETEETKNKEIDKIKETIKHDYTDIPNDKWQLGHKNPGSIDNTKNNMILQPPIQAKYKDEYIFFDTLTKMPLPCKLKSLIEKKEIEITDEQLDAYLELFNSLKITNVKKE